MKVDVVMPKMGESIQEGKILQWLKKEGDKVERDEILLEISTDKVDTEVPSPSAGVLVKISVPEGDTVEVGTVIAQLETDVNAAASGSPAPEQPAAQPVQQAAAPEPAPQAAQPVAAQPVVAQPEAAPAPQEAPQPAAQEEVAADTGATIDVVMPKMGESIQEGKVLQWLKKEGDKVERDEILLEISTDKVDTEVPSPSAGTLVKILVGEGDTVEVGTVIAKIGSGSAAPAAKPAAPAPQPVANAAPAPQPAAPQPAAAPHTNGTTPKAATPAVVTGTTPARRTSGSRFYSPLVRTIAGDKNVSLEELDTIEGSGLEGRVTKSDLMSYLENRTSGKSAPAPQPVAKDVPAPAPAAAPAEKAPVAKAAPAVAAKPAAPSLSKEQLEAKFGDRADIVQMDHIRTLIAEHMVHSKHTSAHVTSVAEADVTGIVRAREKFKNDFQKREGIKLTFTPFIAAAVVEAVRRFMNVNVSVDGKFIIKHKRINLGVATALDDGNLIVPVIKSADALNITGIGRAVNDLSLRARSKKLSPDEIQGGTVTLTNVGTFGTLFGTPVINQPQVAIFGVGAIKKRPVVKEVEGNDLIVIRHMVYMSITYDHRVVDGMLAGQCLAAVCESLESMNENTVRL